MSNFLLNCPITGQKLIDPITLPCCGNSTSRNALIEKWLQDSNTLCPVCCTNLPDFDPLSAPQNSTVNNIINASSSSPVSAALHTWKAMVHKVCENIHELVLILENSQFAAQPSLFIPVVDRSGSMAGAPWNQVKSALKHIVGLTFSNELLNTIVVCYESSAFQIPLVGSKMECERIISELHAGGGTNFRASFEEIAKIFSTCTSDKNNTNPNKSFYGSITIAFMTDGQDGNSNKSETVDIFRNICSKWDGRLVVHSVGFSSGCDQTFLENLRKVRGDGPDCGSFRYAEPSDPEDTLCQKLQSVFDSSTKSATVPITLSIPEGDETKIMFYNLRKTHWRMNVQFPLSKYGDSSLSVWCLGKPHRIFLDSEIDQNCEIFASFDDNQDSSRFSRWLIHLIEEIAFEMVELVKEKTTYSPQMLEFYTCLLKQRVESISDNACQIGGECEINTVHKCRFLKQEIDSLRCGNSVNLGKLSDIRFCGRFNEPIAPTTAHSSTPQFVPVVVPQPQIDEKPAWECNVHYSHNNKPELNRNSLCALIMDQKLHNIVEPTLFDAVLNASIDEICQKDADGNTALHLAAYSGLSLLLKHMFDVHKDHLKPLVNQLNNHNETPVTLCIKKRGYTQVLKILLAFGGCIPSDRKDGLQQFCVNNKFTRTATIVSQYIESNAGPLIARSFWTLDFLQFSFDSAVETKREIDFPSFFDCALSHCAINLLEKIQAQCDLFSLPCPKFTFEQFLKYCLPPKPDDPETPKYIELTKFILKSNPDYIHQKDASTGETVLFRACQKGSLPHVQLFLSLGAEIDEPNDLGNTPLWITTAKRYPCIMNELLNNGADPNRANFKGNVPLSNLCQTGPAKMVTPLLAMGADPCHINSNGDTLVLLCCRNGQHEVLSLLLDMVDEDFVNFKAHIDGFNAIFASVEAYRPECLRVIHDRFKCNLNQKTDDDNAILGGATPLHLAAYYNRNSMIQLLIDLGANPHLTNIDGQTPLHIAVTQNNPDIVRILVQKGQCDPFALDKYGNTAASFARNKPEILNVMLSAVTSSLAKLARAEFGDEQEKAMFLFKGRSYSIGCVSHQDLLNSRLFDCSTPLLHSFIVSNFNVAEEFIKMGADPSIKNIFGLNCFDWVQITNNARMKKLLPNLKPDPELANRLRKAKQTSTQDASLLFFSSVPKNTQPLYQTSLPFRMSLLYPVLKSSPHAAQILAKPLASSETFWKIIQGQKPLTSDFSTLFQKTSLVSSHSQNTSNSSNSSSTQKDTDETQQYLWNAKVFTANLVAAGEMVLSPSEIYSLALFTNNNVIPNVVHAQIISMMQTQPNSFVCSLLKAIQRLPMYNDEVYLGCPQVDRSLFQVGSTIQFNSVLSCSTMWSIAHEIVSPGNNGVIFIIKSETARCISRYSQFSHESECIFLPLTEFVVTAWYRYNQICLGQRNIRHHTFEIKTPEELFVYLENTKPPRNLIIELQEITSTSPFPNL